MRRNLQTGDKKAGLFPYRVDEHYDAEKPIIETIREEIEKSAVCLAEISEDNPNVWYYELGFAHGRDIPAVLICEEGKRDNLPFDVNQRNTYFYGTDSRGDWNKLEEEIATRLRKTVSGKSPAEKERISVTKDSGNKNKFRETEHAMLKIFYFDSEEDPSLGEKSRLKEEMRRLGFSNPDITNAFNN